MTSSNSTTESETPMGDDVMILLLDSPEDVLCEARGWVSCDVPIDHARWLLEDFCADENGQMPARPIGDPQRVWLECDDPTKPADEQRWHPSQPGEGVEFWEFDATDVQAVKVA